jgi:hypothetical protein
MVTRKSVGAVLGGVGLVLSSVLITGAVSVRRVEGPATVSPSQAPWAHHLDTMDQALASGDTTGALKAWEKAYGAALGSRRWDGFADAGDAYLRLSQASASPAAGLPRVRDLYLTALFRAKDAGSREGVLRAAEAFTAIGDHDVAGQAVKMASRMPGNTTSVDRRSQLTVRDEITTAPVVF